MRPFPRGEPGDRRRLRVGHGEYRYPVPVPVGYRLTGAPEIGTIRSFPPVTKPAVLGQPRRSRVRRVLELPAAV
jgi:hypothetical protein